MGNLKGTISSPQTLSGGSAINVAVTPDIKVGTVTTLDSNVAAYVELDENSTKMNPVLNFGLPKGADYVITDEDYETIETNVKSDIQPILEEIENVSKQAEVIARGRATGYVFDTVNDLDTWLLVEENVSKLVLGDNFYIRDIGVPDYWWDGATKQVLEVEKPDLTAYAKKEQFVTLTQAEYDALTEKSANTYYFIIEEE